MKRAKSRSQNPRTEMSAKLTHYTVDYLSSHGMPHQNCDGCAHLLVRPEIGCRMVASPIALTGWCMRWEKKTAPVAAEKVFEQSPHA